MPKPLIIAGTGTDVGKTVFSSLVMARYGRELSLKYLKPIQTGVDSDTATVTQVSGLDESFFLREIYQFKLAASPHYAAESEGKVINFSEFASALKKFSDDRVLIELAGGLMVPINRYQTNLNLIRALEYPVVLIASTALGTINHTLLSLAALGKCAGVFFVGPNNDLFVDNAHTIHEMTGVKILGHHFLEGGISPENFDADGQVRKLLQ